MVPRSLWYHAQPRKRLSTLLSHPQSDKRKPLIICKVRTQRRCISSCSFLVMRLLNSSTFQLEDFFPDRIPAYAILSHTWEADEVLFADMERGSAERKAGYKKIRYSCVQAAAHGFDYVWVDTCCIDKSSSAELSEAINSMYSWYQKAEICYAYLADVPATVDARAKDSAFAKSKWFKRGWTLQELIAPSKLVFFSDDWVEVGKKSTLYDIISDITGIHVDIITSWQSLDSTSVATRMSWASHRATTRVEDIAYCLMGLFEVNMPMLYGEGKRAFIRLQEEIMKNSDDQSLFAWTDPTAPPDSYHGLLAKSPADFVDSGKIMSYRDAGAPFSISNKGLRIDLYLRHLTGDIYVAALCCLAPPDYEGIVGIYLNRISPWDNQYARVKPQTLCKPLAGSILETVYVRQTILFPRPQDKYRSHHFLLRKDPTLGNGYELIDAIAHDEATIPASSHRPKWVPTSMPFAFKLPKGIGKLAGALLLERNDGERLLIMLGSTADFEVAFDVAAVSEIGSFRALQRLFIPRAPGTSMLLKHHRVLVDVEPQIRAGFRYYMVDMVVDAIYQPQDPFQGLRSQPDERQSNTTSSPPHAVSKWKTLFK